MANIPPPGALSSEKTVAYDVMRHGGGNIWEDRGSRGLIFAFFATCLASLFRPHIVCDQIRRPETTSDATTFTIGCGVLWGLGWVGNAVIDYHHRTAINEPRFDEQATAHIVGTVLQFLVAPLIAYLFVRVGSVIFFKLVAGEMEHQFRPTLAYNVMAYCLGPSILAVIPIVGIPLALLWSLVAMMVAARTRLYLRVRTVIICTPVTYFACVAAIALSYLVVWLVWVKVIINLYVLPPIE